MIGLVNALKAARRGIYKYSENWRVLVAVQHNRQVPALWGECRALLDASSLPIESARWATRVIQMDRGGIIRVAAIGDLTDAYCYAGHSFTQIIWLYSPEQKVEQYVASFLRSTVVPLEELRTDFAEW